MTRRALRTAIATVVAAVIALGVLGAVGYGRDYDVHRGFSTLVNLPRAGKGRLLDERFYSSALHRSADYLVYLPPGYDDDPDRRYAVVYVIQGYTGHVAMWRNRSPFRQPFIETADAVFARGEAPPALVVYVDAWTSYGGSQFVDSPGTGRYHSYLCEEVVPWVDQRYRTLAGAAHRAIAGKSSGGFGAMITPMLLPPTGPLRPPTRPSR